MEYPKLTKLSTYILKKIPDGSYTIESKPFWYLGQKCQSIYCGGTLEYCKAVLDASGITDYAHEEVT